MHTQLVFYSSNLDSDCIVAYIFFLFHFQPIDLLTISFSQIFALLYMSLVLKRFTFMLIVLPLPNLQCCPLINIHDDLADIISRKSLTTSESVTSLFLSI